MPGLKHTHKYVKVTLGRNNDYYLYKCIKAGCSHNIQPVLMIGVEAECYDCGDKFTIDSKSDLIEKLKCLDCRKGPNISDDEVLEVLNELRDKES